LSLAVLKLKIDQELPEDRSVGPTNRHTQITTIILPV